MFWRGCSNIIIVSLIVPLCFEIGNGVENSFTAPQSAYPEFANPRIKSYDLKALSAIVKLINPPHLKLTRVPARLLDKSYSSSFHTSSKISTAKQFQDLPHFDTPTFEYFSDVNVKQTDNNEITTKENWNSLNVTTENHNDTSIKAKRKLDFTTEANRSRQLNISVVNTKEITDRKSEPKLESATERREEVQLKNLSDYRYNYSVSDKEQKDVKSHSEVRNGGIVTGQYSILEPDGYTRVVSYYSDGKSGFKARVLRIAPVKTNLIK